MRKFFPFFLLGFLLLFTQALLALDVDPKAIGSASFDANFSWVVDFGSTRLPNEATLKIYPPSNNAYQSASYSSSMPFSIETDEFGNRVLAFEFVPSSSTETISLNAKITTSFDPLKADYPPATESPATYLVQSDLVGITDEISSISQSTVQGKASNDFEKLALLSEWVHYNIEYDLNWKSFAAGSVDTLKSRRGTCDEMGHLLIAMLRSQKIPARLVVGYVYSGEKWGPHAWVEALIGGKWVPADPTYGEVGALDATHVQIATGRDQDDTRFEISAKGYDLDLSRTTITPDAQISFVEMQNFSNYFSLDATFPKGFRDEASLETVTATLRSLLSQKTVAVPVSLLLYKDFKTIGYKDKIAVLMPGEEKNVSWGIIYPETMEDGYYYNYSAAVIAQSERVDATLEGKKGSQKNVDESVSITGMRATRQGGIIALSIAIQNTGNVEFESVSAELNTTQKQDLQQFPLAVGETKTIEYLVPLEGGDVVLVQGTLDVRAGKTRFFQPIQITLAPKPTPSPAPAPATAVIPSEAEKQFAETVSNASQQATQTAKNLSDNLSQALARAPQEDLLIYAILATILILLLIIIKTILLQS